MMSWKDDFFYTNFTSKRTKLVSRKKGIQRDVGLGSLSDKYLPPRKSEDHTEYRVASQFRQVPDKYYIFDIFNMCHRIS
jgi:hypothetical protein